MSRRVKFISPQQGDIHILAIWEQPDGSWEGDWDVLRGTRVGDQFSKVTQAAFDHALHRYHRPLVDQLGIPPEGALRKLPSQLCALRHRCIFYDARNCLAQAKKMPHCFEPDDIESDAVRRMAASAIQHWRESVYLVVVTP